MSAPKHTAEPWHISGIHPRNIHIGSMDSPMVLASMNDIHTQTPENAARIVACVNACAGVANADLHAGGVVVAQRELIRRGELMAKAAEDLDALRAQRDELAAALRDLYDASIGTSSKEKCARLHARVALAKLDGGS